MNVANAQALIEKYAVPEPTTGCWLWSAALREKGYGHVWIRDNGVRTSWRAHRLAWVVYRGPILDDQLVLHRCDTPACVNVEHLFLGTHRQNMDDMVAKGRAWRGPIKRSPHLDEARVVAARAAFFSGAATTYELARELGITPERMRRALRYETFAHLP